MTSNITLGKVERRIMADIIVESKKYAIKEYNIAFDLTLKQINEKMDLSLGRNAFVKENTGYGTNFTYETADIKCEIKMHKLDKKIKVMYGCMRKCNQKSDSVIAKMLFNKIEKTDYAYCYGYHLRKENRMANTFYKISDQSNFYEFISENVYAAIVYYIKRLKILGIKYE